MKLSFRYTANKPGWAFIFLLFAGVHSAQAQIGPDPLSFQATVTADKPSFFLGENVLLRYCLINKSNDTGHIWVDSPNYDFKVTATDENGTELPEAPWDVRSPDRMLGSKAIGPGNQWCESVALTEKLRIDDGGTFTVHVSFNVDNSYLSFVTKGAAKYPFVRRAVEAHTTVILVMPREGEAQTLVGEVEGRQSGPLGPDFSAMRYDVYLAPLLERAQAGNISALRAISHISTSQATNALIDLSKNGISDIASQAESYLKQRLLDHVMACIVRSPGNYRSVWGLPLNFSQAQVSARPESDRFNVLISEGTLMGKRQGIALDVNLRTGECINIINKLE